MDEGADPAASMREFLDGISVWGGASAGPGEQGSFGVTLPVGSYAVVGALYPSEGEPSDGEAPEEMPAPPTNVTKRIDVVADGAPTAPPAVDATVHMVEFAFAFPADLGAGAQTWEFVNSGAQVHVAAIMKLLPGKTMADVMSYAEAFEGDDPTEEFAYVGMVSPGVSNFLILDLTPGTYVAVCWFPDYAEGGVGAPHNEHGMLQSFDVRED